MNTHLLLLSDPNWQNIFNI